MKKDSDIIENKDFENGIVKIQEHEELNLTQAEKNAVKIFLKPVAATVVSLHQPMVTLNRPLLMLRQYY